MRVLVTRPLEDAKETARLLEAMGHEGIIAPLLEIRFHDGLPVSLEGVQAILATSANGVRALARRTNERSVPVFCVGPQTAEAAKAASFAHIKSAGGDVKALAEAISQWASPDAGALLHAAGQETEGKLESDLARAGFSVRRETLYEAVASVQLPEAVINALGTSNLDAMFFFSPRSAKVFCQCVERAGLAAQTTSLTACCISKNTADALSLSFRKVHIALQPNQSALLDCLRGHPP
ncbi:MAG TPA: uroporphyrinogen-III synthase [Rhizomicrobium sp.]|jgi:uroporphyrinogen-III synthase|nr:uroporphyrinogen-III synthase [Rhizomicrobium sp.]